MLFRRGCLLVTQCSWVDFLLQYFPGQWAWVRIVCELLVWVYWRSPSESVISCRPVCCLFVLMHHTACSTGLSSGSGSVHWNSWWSSCWGGLQAGAYYTISRQHCAGYRWLCHSGIQHEKGCSLQGESKVACRDLFHPLFLVILSVMSCPMTLPSFAIIQGPELKLPWRRCLQCWAA